MDAATIIGLIIAFIAVFGGLGIGIWFVFTRHIVRRDERLADIEARNKERLALIEKGMDPNLADQKPHGKSSNGAFLFGVILIMACLGRIIAYFSAFHFDTGDKTFIYVLPAFFAGFGFLAYHFYQKRISSGRDK
jgi:hypothetical protein